MQTPSESETEAPLRWFGKNRLPKGFPLGDRLPQTASHVACMLRQLAENHYGRAARLFGERLGQ